MPAQSTTIPSLVRASVVPKVTGTHTAATATATAHANAKGEDLFQVINQGGKVVWNLDSAGVPHTNPTNPTATAHLGQHFGSSFATAFPDLVASKLDIYQIHDGSKVVYHVDYLGVAYTP